MILSVDDYRGIRGAPDGGSFPMAIVALPAGSGTQFYVHIVTVQFYVSFFFSTPHSLLYSLVRGENGQGKNPIETRRRVFSVRPYYISGSFLNDMYFLGI